MAIEENERNGDKESGAASPLPDDTALYVREPQYSTRRLLEMINKLSNVAE